MINYFQSLLDSLITNNLLQLNNNTYELTSGLSVYIDNSGGFNFQNSLLNTDYTNYTNYNTDNTNYGDYTNYITNNTNNLINTNYNTSNNNNDLIDNTNYNNNDLIDTFFIYNDLINNAISLYNTNNNQESTHFNYTSLRNTFDIFLDRESADRDSDEFTINQLEDVKIIISEEDYNIKYLKREKNVTNRNIGKLRVEKCTICLDNFELKQKFIKTDCCHYFHKDCFRELLIDFSIKCPICRTDLR